MFKKLVLRTWRQFDKIDITFDDRLTIITGANGSGKTTVLNILGRHFGWIEDIASTPRLLDVGDLEYNTDFWSEQEDKNEEAKKIQREIHSMVSESSSMGNLEYVENNEICDIRVPKQAGTTYQLILNNQQQMNGLMLSSHRNVFHYQPVSSIPTKPIERDEAYNNYLRSKYREEYVGNDSGATRQIKQTLISWAVYGYGNKAVKANSIARNMFEGFQEVLAVVLPPSLGYIKIEIDNPEVVLVTETGNFAIDAVSGGIAALIEICWQIYMCAKDDKSYTVIIDEPENHLHPELQRSIMPSLLRAFPNVQFVVATHNPFVISSSEKSKVYVLNYNSNKKVESSCLDEINKAGTANEILREVLGIPVTMADWVEDRLNKIVNKYAAMEVSKETIEAMKNELRELGLDNTIPESVINVLEKSKQND